MIVDFNFNLEAWVRSIYVEAESEEAAKDKLMTMTLHDILSDDTISTDSDFRMTDIESKVVEYDAVVKVTDIEYDFDGEDFDAFVIERLVAALPKELTLNVRGIRKDDDIEELIGDEILGETDYYTKSFKFQILEMK